MPVSTASTIPPLLPRGTFAGVPSHFRGWCYTASGGGNSGGFRAVGCGFGRGLLTDPPHDLTTDEWASVVGRMAEKFLKDSAIEIPGSAARAGLGAWLHRHFPKMMRLVPRKRFEAFIDGLHEAYDSGEMLADLPEGFEPVDVDLDDPCAGVGYVWVWVESRPTPRRIVYGCSAPACREASQAAVEQYARDRGLPTVEVGGVIAVIE